MKGAGDDESLPLTRIRQTFTEMYETIDSWKDLELIKSYEFQHRDDIYANLSRFKRLVRAEEEHLGKIATNATTEHAVEDAWKTSNVHYLRAVLEIADQHWARGLLCVLGADPDETLWLPIDKSPNSKSRTRNSEGHGAGGDVIVVDWGRTLIKVSAKSEHNLAQLTLQDVESEDEEPETMQNLPLVRHAQQLLRSGKHVIFWFKHRPPVIISHALEQSGVMVLSGGDSIPQPRFPTGPPIGQVVNLDVSTLIALVSEFTWAKGHHRTQLLNVACKPTEYSFREQQRKEHQSPLLQYLTPILRGRSIIVCKEAFDRFNDEIVCFVGGPKERGRWQQHIREGAGELASIMQSIRIVDFANEPLDDPMAKCVAEFSSFPALFQRVLVTGIMQASRLKRDENKVLPGFPLVTTLTSNWSAMKSAKGKVLLNGQLHTIMVHQERSLCEQKLAPRLFLTVP